MFDHTTAKSRFHDLDILEHILFFGKRLLLSFCQLCVSIEAFNEAEKHSSISRSNWRCTWGSAHTLHGVVLARSTKAFAPNQEFCSAVVQIVLLVRILSRTIILLGPPLGLLLLVSLLLEAMPFLVIRIASSLLSNSNWSFSLIQVFFGSLAISTVHPRSRIFIRSSLRSSSLYTRKLAIFSFSDRIALKRASSKPSASSATGKLHNLIEAIVWES